MKIYVVYEQWHYYDECEVDIVIAFKSEEKATEFIKTEGEYGKYSYFSKEVELED